MCLPDCQTEPERADAEAGLAVSRRSALVGAACLALGATIPGSASAARTRARSGSSPMQSQSPIDLRESEITFVDSLPPIEFRYPRSVDVTLVNNTNPPEVPEEFATVRADVPADAGAHIRVDGMRWDLRQFHWHTPSEHEIEGQDTPLEMHFVHAPHRPADPGEPVFLVLAVFMERGDRNRALAPMFDELPEPLETRDVPDVRLRDLLPDERESFRYSGSLTTPPFTEPVLFIVFAEPTELSRRQIEAFQELFEEGNSREPQPLNDREVLSDARDVFDDDD
jgi:carbonic anhydrase